MPWSNDQFDGTLVIPTGATTGARIVLDGDTGVITVYNASDQAIAIVSPTQGFLTQNATGSADFAQLTPNGTLVVGSSDWDNPAVVSVIPNSTIFAAAVNTLSPGNARPGLVLVPGDESGSPPSQAHFDTLNSVTPCDFYLNGVDQGRGIVDRVARTSNTSTVTGTEAVALTSNSVTFFAGRAYRVKVKGVVQSDVTGDTVQLRVRKTDPSGAIYLDTFTSYRVNVAGDNTIFSPENAIRNDSGADVSAALVLTYARGSGTGNVRVAADAVNPAYLEIWDIGASADYPSANEIA